MKMRNKRFLTIGMDVDETLADLHSPWITWGNRMFGTSITEFTHWDAPTDLWGNAAFGFLQPSIYDKDVVRPFKAARPAMDLLRAMGHLVVYVSSCHSPEVAAAKKDWCQRHCGDGVFISSSQKGTVMGLDYLVDDGIHNVMAVGPFRGILMRAPHNRGVVWPHVSIEHLAQLPNLMYLLSKQL